MLYSPIPPLSFAPLVMFLHHEVEKPWLKAALGASPPQFFVTELSLCPTSLLQAKAMGFSGQSLVGNWISRYVSVPICPRMDGQQPLKCHVQTGLPLLHSITI